MHPQNCEVDETAAYTETGGKRGAGAQQTDTVCVKNSIWHKLQYLKISVWFTELLFPRSVSSNHFASKYAKKKKKRWINLRSFY